MPNQNPPPPRKQPEEPAQDKAPLTDQGVPLEEILAGTIRKVKNAIAGAGQEMAVDLELTFKSISVTESGLFFSEKRKEESLEVRIATRVRGD